MLIAHVRENVFDTDNGQYLLVPHGARPIELYDQQMAYGMPGTGAAGAAGFDGQVNHNLVRVFGRPPADNAATPRSVIQ